MSENDWNNLEKVVLVILSVITLMIAAMLMTSCRQVEYVTVPEVHSDTLYINKVQRDSINVHDSIFVNVNGDTVRIEKWHTKYIESIKHDTIYEATHDTIAKPYPVEVKVEKELTWWQRTKMKAGVAFIALLGGAILWLLYKLARRLGLINF